jgi:hypothetical protein
MLLQLVFGKITESSLLSVVRTKRQTQTFGCPVRNYYELKAVPSFPVRQEA